MGKTLKLSLMTTLLLCCYYSLLLVYIDYFLGDEFLKSDLIGLFLVAIKKLKNKK